MKKTIGGNRLGSGGKMEVDLRTYERSTHDLSYIWRSTMAAGTLVPFMSEVALPGDTFDIDLDCNVMTHPTVGPLFGSYKVQLDVFQCPVRLYHAALNNNKLGIGMNMAQVKLPLLQLRAYDFSEYHGEFVNLDNQQINPSALLSYLNIRGVGNKNGASGDVFREFNAIPLIAYWDIYKNYYANKQEGKGAFINNSNTVDNNIQSIQVFEGLTGTTIPLTGSTISHIITTDSRVVITYLGEAPHSSSIKIITPGGTRAIDTLFYHREDTTGTITFTLTTIPAITSVGEEILSYTFTQPIEEAVTVQEPKVQLFDLVHIDDFKTQLLQQSISTPFIIDNTSGTQIPYRNCVDNESDYVSALMCSQQGLGIKTYQSDLFNNWMETEWIDGTNGISEITSIDTSGGSFSIDTLNLSKKVYDMLNRIAISGGSYDDWLDAVYNHDRYTAINSPVYQGGLIKELIFQEVVSNAQAVADDNTQPLGTLAGKGAMSGKHKGGKITVKVDEPSYIIGIVSLTPRVDYSQGNKWDIHLKTMDDFHKPALDEIGFQDDICEQRAWWDTTYDGTKWVQKSAGKQPAWLNYMTNVNQARGNFAIEDNEMFMTLNRRYEYNGTDGIKDLTTYIDPVKYNQIFAQSSRDAQNFWTQIALNITARRKMSAKIMPNL